MEVEIVRHHRSADDTDGDEQCLRVGDGRNKTRRHFAQHGFGQKHLHRERAADNQHEAENKCLQLPDTQLHKKQQQKCVEHADGHTPSQRNAKKQLEANGHAHHLGQIGGGDGDFGEDVVENIGCRVIEFAGCLRQIAPRHHTEPGAQALQQQCDEVGHQQHPQQLVAKTATSREVGRPVAGIHVAHADQIGRAEKSKKPPPKSTFHIGFDGAVHFGQRYVGVGYFAHFLAVR